MFAKQEAMFTQSFFMCCCLFVFHMFFSNYFLSPSSKCLTISLTVAIVYIPMFTKNKTIECYVYGIIKKGCIISVTQLTLECTNCKIN